MNTQDAILSLYRAIPSKYKPKDGEFTVLAAFIAHNTLTEQNFILSAATGTKCLGIEKANDDRNGCLIEDSHAEILAKRGFQRYLYKCLNVLSTCPNATQSANFPFQYDEIKNSLDLKRNWAIQLFISDCPCGDASIYACHEMDNSNTDSLFCQRQHQHKHLTMQSVTYQYTGAKLPSLSNLNFTSPFNMCCKHNDNNGNNSDSNCAGKELRWVKEATMQQLGILRLKSGRSDLPPGSRTVSKSCTDKICKWIHVGLQGSLLSNFFSPIFLSKILIGHDPHTTIEEQRSACLRGIINRVSTVGQTSSARTISPPDIEIVSMLSLGGSFQSYYAGLGKCFSAYSSEMKQRFEQEIMNSTSSEDTVHALAKRKRSSSSEVFVLASSNIDSVNNPKSNGFHKKSVLRPCGTSINWIRDVCVSHYLFENKYADTNYDTVEMGYKHVIQSIDGGSLEILQAHNGVLHGTIAKNVGKLKFSSRLSRRSLSSLFANLLRIAPLVDRKCFNGEYNGCNNDNIISRIVFAVVSTAFILETVELNNKSSNTLSCSNRTPCSNPSLNDTLIGNFHVTPSRELDSLSSASPDSVIFLLSSKSYRWWKLLNFSYQSQLKSFKELTSFECWNLKCSTYNFDTKMDERTVFGSISLRDSFVLTDQKSEF